MHSTIQISHKKWCFTYPFVVYPIFSTKLAPILPPILAPICKRFLSRMMAIVWAEVFILESLSYSCDQSQGKVLLWRAISKREDGKLADSGGSHSLWQSIYTDKLVHSFIHMQTSLYIPISMIFCYRPCIQHGTALYIYTCI